MPRKSKAVTRYRKKKTYRKKKSYIPLGLYEKSRLCRLRYCEEILINAGAGVLATHNFIANGLFDPNQTGVGHQPKCFDQAMLAYNHYQVLGSRMTATYLPFQTTNMIPSQCGIHLSDTTGVIGAYSLEQIYESRLINPKAIKTINNKEGRNTVLSCNFSSKKMFGKASHGSDRLRGSSSTNPTEQAVFQLFQYSVGGNNPDSVTFMVQIDYVVLFSELKPVPQS